MVLRRWAAEKPTKFARCDAINAVLTWCRFSRGLIISIILAMLANVGSKCIVMISL